MIKLHLGRKTLACLIFEDVFRDGGGVVDWAYGVNVESIKINKEFGTTVLCNLHQIDLAKKYSDRLVGLMNGKIIFDEKSKNIKKSLLEKIYI